MAKTITITLTDRLDGSLRDAAGGNISAYVAGAVRKRLVHDALMATAAANGGTLAYADADELDAMQEEV